MSHNLLVIGLHWGDEGKGKIIDAISDRFDIIIRYQGGANAGHTVRVNGERFVLHLIPSGILRPDKLCIVGNGLVVDPEALVEEIDSLRGKGVHVGQNLAVSQRAHMVLPYHKVLDRLSETSLGGKKIGTTGRGIGPCYADKATRCGLRFADLLDPQMFRQKLKEALEIKNRILSDLYGADPIEFEPLYQQCLRHRERLLPFLKDTVVMIAEALRQGRSILLEGAQGTMLDINFGTYPYVTSSDVAAGGAATGTGIPPKRIDRVLGVVKAYCSRVGRGPFPTEQDNHYGEKMRERGQEYGSTTGRPRRCGWLDAAALRHAVAVNGVDGIAVTLLDVLSEFEILKICVAYELDGKELKSLPADPDQLGQASPIYEELPGWRCDISNVTRWADLPPEARGYLDAVERAAGARIEMASVGPERGQIVKRTTNGDS